MLAEHRLSLETEYHQGHRAQFLISRSERARFLGPQSARDQDGPRLAHRGSFQWSPSPKCELGGRHCRAGVLRSCGFIPGTPTNLVSASLEDACLTEVDMEFALMAKVMLRGACLREADMSGAQLDAAELEGFMRT